ncbi:MAG: Hsp20/alpha crystallin family protein [Pyrinomonadaceae bacterium]
MTQQKTALETTEKKVPVSVEPSENIFERIRKTTEAIAHRAFELFETRGRQFGNEIEDWLRAEAELAGRIPIDVRETDDDLEIRAELPGFKPEEIEILLEPTRLTISGESSRESDKSVGDTLYSEWHGRKVFRSFDLPREVKTGDLTAVLKNGILNLTLPKAEAIEPKEIPITTD